MADFGFQIKFLSSGHRTALPHERNSNKRNVIQNNQRRHPGKTKPRLWYWIGLSKVEKREIIGWCTSMNEIRVVRMNVVCTGERSLWEFTWLWLCRQHAASVSYRTEVGCELFSRSPLSLFFLAASFSLSLPQFDLYWLSPPGLQLPSPFMLGPFTPH